MKEVILNRTDAAKLNTPSFGGLFFCERQNLLFRTDGTIVPIRNKTLHVFRQLARKHDCVVSPPEIFEQVWGNVQVTNDSLVQCICEIRKLMGDQASQSLKTFSRRGYALISDRSLAVHSESLHTGNTKSDTISDTNSNADTQNTKTTGGTPALPRSKQ